MIGLMLFGVLFIVAGYILLMSLAFRKEAHERRTNPEDLHRSVWVRQSDVKNLNLRPDEKLETRIDDRGDELVHV